MLNLANLRARFTDFHAIDAWHYFVRGVYWFFLVGVFPWCAHWFYHLPSAGKAIGVLAAIGVVVALRENVPTRHRALWAFATLLLLVIEVKAIDKDRADQLLEHLRDLNRQQEAQAQTLLQITLTNEAQMAQNQTQFEQTLYEMAGINKLSRNAVTLSTKAVREITGGGQYCYLMAIPSAPGTAAIIVMNSGPLPLERCLVIIHRSVPFKPSVQNPKTPEEFEKLQQEMKSQFDLTFRPIVAKELGPVAPGKKPGEGEGLLTDISLPFGSYYIQIITRNDRFYETLEIHPDYPNGKTGYESIEIKDQTGKAIYSSP
jgi:hypothetical protein